MNKADTKADAVRAFDDLARGIEKIATTRRELREKYPESPMPDDVRQLLANTRKMLRKAGVPQRVIDTTPGLEPPDWMGR